MSGGGGSPSPYEGSDPLGDLGASGGPVPGVGNGRSGGTGDTAADGSAETACSALRFRAGLRSVNPDELALVQVGDVLLVKLFSADRPQIGAFRVTDDGTLAQQPVGVLLERVVNLLPCLSVLDFVADVEEIDGGSVTVIVRPAEAV